MASWAIELGGRAGSRARREIQRIRHAVRDDSEMDGHDLLEVGSFGSFGIPPPLIKRGSRRGGGEGSNDGGDDGSGSAGRSGGDVNFASPSYIRCSPPDEPPNAFGNPSGAVKPRCPTFGGSGSRKDSGGAPTVEDQRGDGGGAIRGAEGSSISAGGRAAVWMWSDWLFVGSPAALRPLARMTSNRMVLSSNQSRCYGLCQEEQTSLQLTRSGVHLKPLRGLPVTIRKILYHPWPCNASVQPPLLNATDLSAMRISNWYAACPPPLKSCAAYRSQ